MLQVEGFLCVCFILPDYMEWINSQVWSCPCRPSEAMWSISAFSQQTINHFTFPWPKYSYWSHRSHNLSQLSRLWKCAKWKWQWLQFVNLAWTELAQPTSTLSTGRMRELLVTSDDTRLPYWSKTRSKSSFRKWDLLETSGHKLITGKRTS